MSLSRDIYRIGRKLVKCTNGCEDVNCNPSEGVLPRCLILESASGQCQNMGGNNDPGCAIVGLNPGNSNGHLGLHERNFYMKNGCSYRSVADWFNLHGAANRYNYRMRELVRGVSIKGQILWSELAKCENSPSHNGALSEQTYRICAGAYLTKEIGLLPADWPLFGVGRESYKALAYLFPSRAVIGVPHPTGSRGHFHALFNGNNIGANNITQGVIADVQSACRNRAAVWLK